MPELLRTGSDTAQRLLRSDVPCLGPWAVVELLGVGTWSRVYRARPRHRSDGAPSDYALKVPQTTQDQATAVRLLRREALVGQEVSHPHLACVLSAHLQRPPYYVVLPYIAGVNLQAVLDAVPQVPLPHALWIVRQTAEALQALHGQGWLHGDVKPGNLLVSSEGHVTLLDLSLAARISDLRAGTDGPWTGTLDYAPPEMFGSLWQRGPASDVYSLGILAYRLITGRLPFAAGSAANVAQAHLHEIPPDPRRYQPRVTRHLARVLNQLLAKQPECRPTGRELVQVLAALEIDTFDERQRRSA